MGVHVSTTMSGAFGERRWQKNRLQFLQSSACSPPVSEGDGGSEAVASYGGSVLTWPSALAQFHAEVFPLFESKRNDQAV